MVDKFLTFLVSCGWKVERNELSTYHLPDILKSRYKNCPQSWLDFIASVKSMVSSDETSWFLCAADYAPQAADSFQWNEWESLSLAAAQGDTAWQESIIKFWDTHLPIFMSVKDGYSYYAVSMKDGSIVYGSEPEFEACEPAAASFEDFMRKIVVGQIKL